MGKVHNLHYAKNQREPDTQKRIRAPKYQRIGYVLKKLIHYLPHLRALPKSKQGGA